ncbi:dynein intermediate chain 3, ciliary-like [Bombyx mandarina]|uniref:Dynein intermediate chain 3, ciliary-like n=1 Tax=Bombyx mandarina TaxID=7092 RepID=A0A6J2JBS6_BOMMA|nr:dynein intermediate chain 3, ciliary-like [Bombyx mandarina]
MDLSRPYVNFRKQFGKQPRFCEVPVHLIDSIAPNKGEQRKYCLRNTVNQEVQTIISKSENEVNTHRITSQEQGVNHVEGGWPKEINFLDEEITSRYRHRVEREDTYVEVILNQYENFEHYLKQNNAIEMYEMFYKKMPHTQLIEKSALRINSLLRDTDNRPIACIGWSCEDNPKIVVAYCNKKYPIRGPINSNLSCYVWDVEYPRAPNDEFYPPSPCWEIACSPINPSVVVGGLEDGTVCIFDLRSNKNADAKSPMHLAHRDPVSALVYIQSRQNNEFFSGSTDGSCKWWDIRQLSNPTETLIMSVNAVQGEQATLANSEGVYSLQYDRAFPTRFLCGTDTGLVINVNRKGRTHREMLSAVFHAHKGPVKAVHRSQCTSKMFLTCGDWTVHIWSEDILSSPIVSGIPHRHQITDAVWAPQRFSSFMTVSVDGKFRYWDILRKYREPVAVLPVSKNPLLKIKPNEEGRLIAIGDGKGMIYILSLSENLIIPGDRDRQLMTQTYDRETRREHILEARVKEIRVKLKSDDKAAQAATKASPAVDLESLLKTTEEEYRRVVSEELRRAGITPVSSRGRGAEMRKR